MGSIISKKISPAMISAVVAPSCTCKLFAIKYKSKVKINLRGFDYLRPLFVFIMRNNNINVVEKTYFNFNNKTFLSILT